MLRDIWPEWEIDSLISHGSFGTVYKASKLNSMAANTAAIKIISITGDNTDCTGLSFDASRSMLQEAVDDCTREIEMMLNFKSAPNIVIIEDYERKEIPDTVGWRIFIRMELLTPLTELMRNRSLKEADVIKLGMDICTALEYCAKENVIHRDIKPANIFINKFGDYKLGDFGIAKKLESLSGHLSRKGTPNYMAPEIFNNVPDSDSDSTVDTYSLGIVLYQLLNNYRLPFIDPDKQILSYDDPEKALRKRVSGEALPLPCNASSEMAKIILKACSFSSADRYKSAGEMKRDLNAVPLKMSLKYSEEPRDINEQDIPASSEIASSPEEETFKKDSEKKPKRIIPYLIGLSLIASAAGILLFCGKGDIKTTDYYGILSDKEKQIFYSADATSCLSEENRAVFAADGDLSSCWLDGVKGNGKGEAIRLSFEGMRKVKYLSFCLGSSDDDYIFSENGRPKKIKAEFSDGKTAFFTFEDSSEAQIKKLSETVNTEYITFTIMSVYPGKSTSDTGIREIAAYAQGSVSQADEIFVQDSASEPISETEQTPGPEPYPGAEPDTGG